MRGIRQGLLSLVIAFFFVGQSRASAVAEEEAEKKEKPAKAEKDAETGIEWEITPPSVTIFLDGKRLGEASATKYTKTTAGRHSVRLVNGEDETEMEISVKKGQKLKFSFTFDED